MKVNEPSTSCTDFEIFTFHSLSCSNSTECKEWIDCINLAAATLSAPPLPSGVGSQKKFQRPLLPATFTKYNIVSVQEDGLICLGLFIDM